LAGKLTDSSGKALNGVEIKIENPSTKTEQRATTSEDGGFEFPNLPAGRYRIRAKDKTFDFRQDDVLVNRGDWIYLRYGGGGPLPPRTYLTLEQEFDVHELTFASESEALEWLRKQGQAQWEVTSVTPVADTKSFFTVRKSTKQIAYSVVSVEGQISGSAIKSRVHNNEPRVFVGIHRIHQDRWLMIFHE
jgi:hypothetical protein